jgi:alkylation response protein AidB-like acyl-CoA dehydrogenase
MATEIEAARALVWRAAWAVDHDPGAAAHLESMAKVYAGQVAVRVAVNALELHGGYGVLRDNHVEKLVRDAVSMLHAFGGNHAMRDSVASKLWGVHR